MSLYRKIFSQSWKMTWHRKYLWFFGLFAAILTSGGAEIEILNKSLGGDGEDVFSLWRVFGRGLMMVPNFFRGAVKLSQDDPWSLLIALFILFVIAILVLFVVWLSISSQTALVNNAALDAVGKDNDIKVGIVAGVEKFWPVFGLNMIDRLAIGALSIILALPITLNILDGSSKLDTAIYILLFLIFVPLALVISFVINYAIGFSVIRGRKFWESIGDGWKLFTDNWIVSIEMMFSLFALSFLFAAGVIILMLILLVPFAFTAFVFYYISGSILFFWIIAGLTILFIFIAIVLAGSIFSTFQIVAWTNLFIELVGRGGTSKIVRLMEKVMK